MCDGTLSVIVTTMRFDDWFLDTLDSILADLPAGADVVVACDSAPVPIPAMVANTPAVTCAFTGGGAGASGANNLGIATSTGTLVARIDGDDLNLSGRLTSQRDFLDDNPECGAVFSNAFIVDAGGARRGLYHTAPIPDVAERLLRTNPVIHSSVMFRRSKLVEAGPYDERLRRMQDYDLMLRLASLAPIGYLDEPAIEYRVHASQSSRQASAYLSTMAKIHSRRLNLARTRGVSGTLQWSRDVTFAAAQLLRYLGLRKSRILKQAGANRGISSQTRGPL